MSDPSLSRQTTNHEEFARLAITEFPATDRERYLRWDRFRLAVFADELGWRLASHPGGARNYSDPFDEHAQLFLAEDRAAVVGIVRCLHVTKGFPHRELFERHLQASGLDERVSTVGTVNALAVIPSKRRRVFASESDGQLGTASALLIRASVQSLVASGVAVVLATVLSPVSARAFIRMGFRLLDVPFVSPDDDRFVLANVGMVVGAGPHAEDQGRASSIEALPALSTSEYFERCQAVVFSQGNLEELFLARRMPR